jgi:hypothetical protein
MTVRKGEQATRTRRLTLDDVLVIDCDQSPFPEEVKRKIFGGNALRLFNLDTHGRRRLRGAASEASAAITGS